MVVFFLLEAIACVARGIVVNKESLMTQFTSNHR